MNSLTSEYELSFSSNPLLITEIRNAGHAFQYKIYLIG